MAGRSDMRQKIIDDVIDALQHAGDDSTIDVRLEGRRVVVIINTAGAAAAPAPRAAREEAPVSHDVADKVMSVLGEERNHKGLNLKQLAHAVGLQEKAALRPVVAAMTKDRRLKKVGQLLRRADVTVKRGRKAQAKAEAKAAPRSAAPKKPGRPAKTEAAPADRTFAPDEVAALLRDHPPGYSLIELTRKLGAPDKSKMQLKPVLARMAKQSGEDQVEKKGPFYRLKNLVRKPGRKAKGGEAPAAPKPAAKAQRGPGRPKRASAPAKAEKPVKRGPGRPKGSKNTPPPAEPAPEPEPAEKPAKSKKDASLSELLREAKAKAHADLVKQTKKTHRFAEDDQLDESGQIKRELTRVPVDGENADDGAAD